ncbi:Prolipoprotein diacylglyceryl transferase [Desulfonispora thiosulfatigenes DSM 11270]|uniref:Phosphatidylglycerol--prolipoprotein diacylglyceryl transferase n=1 Tax=Desulfonispora thiosulfatigenes DSM 11270 TaxID=656914 RepID=A0A1W1V8M1_DESTI|nr:prolipoprotein diacylglyceryl transferase [Desulfonispora thiosulfatigenes]SMB89381.1 Prolipoprotein diacylglyceryl transferase [Desulfonispora thiosulfatigenes DSM 11270]
MIDPVALEIGPLQIRWYGILMSTALLLGTILALREIRRQNIDEDKFLNVLLVAIPFGFIGARLYYVIFKWDYYSQFPSEIPAVWHGGLAIHGGIIGAFIAGYIMVRISKLNFWQIGDIVAPSLILGQAIGRWGNFINQEAYGYVVDKAKVPWAMMIDGAYRHPTFLYESIWNLIGFLALLWARKKSWIKQGEILLGYFIFYSLGRFMVEGFRTDSLMLGPLRIAQVMSIALLIGAISLIVMRRKKQPR